MTPLMYSSAPAVVKSSSRYARLASSVDSTPIESSLFLIVPVLSSAARMPLPSATSAFAVDSSSWMSIDRPPSKASPLDYPASPAFATEPRLRMPREGRRCGGRPSVFLCLGSRLEPMEQPVDAPQLVVRGGLEASGADPPRRMDLPPSVRGVVDPRPYDLDPLSDLWDRDTGAVPRDDLDDERPAEARVRRRQELLL